MLNNCSHIPGIWFQNILLKVPLQLREVNRRRPKRNSQIRHWAPGIIRLNMRAMAHASTLHTKPHITNNHLSTVTFVTAHAGHVPSGQNIPRTQPWSWMWCYLQRNSCQMTCTDSALNWHSLLPLLNYKQHVCLLRPVNKKSFNMKLL